MIGLWITKDGVSYGDVNVYGIKPYVRLNKGLAEAMQAALHFVLIDNIRVPVWHNFPADYDDLVTVSRSIARLLEEAVAADAVAAGPAPNAAYWAISLSPSHDAILWRVLIEHSPAEPVHIKREGLATDLEDAIRKATQYIYQEAQDD